MKEKRIVTVICLFIMLIIAIISLDCGDVACGLHREMVKIPIFGELVRRVQTGAADYVILIDPGHGGMDGGASSSDGTLEKDINLSIAKCLADAAAEYGCRVVLTRETDEWLCDSEEGSIRSRKTADLKARQEMIRKYSPDMTVSIHLNSFKEDPDVKGAQIFYPGSGGQENVLQECESIAETMQNMMNEKIQPHKPRTAMVRDGVFLFKEVLNPMIIIECGFMSNPEEAGKLKTEVYQQELANCIMSGIAEFAELEKPETVEIIDSLI